MTTEEIHREMLAMARAIVSSPIHRTVSDVVDMSQYIVEKILDVETTSDVRRMVREEMREVLLKKEDEDEDYNLESREKQLIIQALSARHNNRRAAAEDLGISERTLYRKIKDYGLDI